MRTGTTKQPMHAPQAAATPASTGSNGDPRANVDRHDGHVRIAPRALRTVVSEAALAVPGVARLYASGGGWAGALGRPVPPFGVGLAVRGTVLAVDLYIVTVAGANMVEVGEMLQAAVGAAIERILGMDVGTINVFIRDVD